MGKKFRKQYGRHEAHSQADRIRVLQVELIDRAMQDAKGEMIGGNDANQIKRAQVDALMFWYSARYAARRQYWLSGLSMTEEEIVKQARRRIGLNTSQAIQVMKRIKEEDTGGNRGMNATQRYLRHFKKQFEPFPIYMKSKKYPEWMKRQAVELYWVLCRINSKTSAMEKAAYLFCCSRHAIREWAKKYSDSSFLKKSEQKRRK